MDQTTQRSNAATSRRSFLRAGLAAGAGTAAISLWPKGLSALADDGGRSLTRGDVAILRFLAAAEIIESDLWQQYNELGGIQDGEVPGGSGSLAYTTALKQLDGDMAQYIHDNTEDEISHFTFINAYLVSKGAPAVNLDRFRTLPSSQATGAQQIGRLTNLMQLTVDTSWWTRYRSRTQEPRSWRHVPAGHPRVEHAASSRRYPATTATSPPRTTCRRSPIRRGSISGSSSRVGPASTPRWRSASAAQRCCASCSVSAPPRPRTSRRGMTRPATA